MEFFRKSLSWVWVKDSLLPDTAVTFLASCSFQSPVLTSAPLIEAFISCFKWVHTLCLLPSLSTACLFLGQFTSAPSVGSFLDALLKLLCVIMFLSGINLLIQSPWGRFEKKWEGKGRRVVGSVEHTGHSFTVNHSLSVTGEKNIP